ncbi:hypothetical protein IFT98_03635 [Pseudomonas sp. CFBP 8770]|uniref:hypothetical protein n=1 Tax=unclassified Pseudomonas TaxID=196821 RepID=UPI0017851E8E|nr:MULTISPECIES: hypothetical protein [unclassified Pseudomonas]MBD8472822.1 hypothetical protein [Pseudomonas sp. CFBP 8773]MBD8646075.1 hypothetical protein [Pseudomonas sp. CFBP 8770]
MTGLPWLALGMQGEKANRVPPLPALLKNRIFKRPAVHKLLFCLNKSVPTRMYPHVSRLKRSPA